jgi:hypothetical protein
MRHALSGTLPAFGALPAWARAGAAAPGVTAGAEPQLPGSGARR